MTKNQTKHESRVHHVITVGIFGRVNGKVDKSVIHTAVIYTGYDRDGLIESVHDRMKRFVNECSGGEGPAEAPAYQIMGVELADAKDRPIINPTQPVVNEEFSEAA